MQYSLTYDTSTKDITFQITSITQDLIDYLLANTELTITGRNNYTLFLTRSGTNILEVFDNGNIRLFIAEDATPETFSVSDGHIYGYGEEDYHELRLRVASVISQISIAILP